MKEPAKDGALTRRLNLMQEQSQKEKEAHSRTSTHQTNRHLERAQQTKQWGADRQMCQMASRAQGRAHVATPHAKRLGPPKSSSHRTEVRILVPTPLPSLRGHNWSTALLAARVRLRNKRRLQFMASRRWLFRPLDSVVDKQRGKFQPPRSGLIDIA